MFFFPYRVNLPLGRIPFFTILISLLCIFVYSQQVASTDRLEKTLQEFCAQQENNRDFNISLTKIKNTNLNNCETVIYYIHHSNNPDKTIQQLARIAQPIDGVSLPYSKQFIATTLQEKYDAIREQLPHDLTENLAYDPTSYDIITMFTSQFAHADIPHLLNNLLFFFAFAASLEVVMGGISFILLSIVISIGVSLAYSASTIGITQPLPTIGLSGVVMGMIGLFNYLMPSAKIRCLFVFLIYFRIFNIPAWILATWFIGWDIYGLFVTSDQGNINLVAHISGAFLGYTLGVIFFRKKKQLIAIHLKKA